MIVTLLLYVMMRLPPLQDPNDPDVRIDGLVEREVSCAPLVVLLAREMRTAHGEEHQD